MNAKDPERLADEFQGKTLAELVECFGPPPDDIIRRWKELSGDEFEIDDQRWQSSVVGPDGRLSIDTVNESVTISPGDGHSVQNVRSNKKSRAENQVSSDGHSRLKRFALPLIAIVVFAAVGVILYQNSSPDSREASGANPKSAQSDVSVTDPFSPSRTPNAEVDASSVEVREPLSLAMESESPINPLSSGFSLDAFMPATSVEVAEVSAVENDESAPMEASQDTMRSITATTLDAEADLGSQPNPADIAADLLSDDDDHDEIQEAVDQPTQRAQGESPVVLDEPQTLFVSLPAVPGKPALASESIELIAITQIPGTLSLQFAHETQWSLRPADDPKPGRWEVIGSEAKPIAEAAPIAEATPIAEVRAVSTDGSVLLTFRWLPAAATRSSVASLSHGRIQLPNGTLIYLRPNLVATSVPLGLDRRDLKLKWDLDSAIATSLTSLDLSIRLPKDVNLEWIEPVDPARIRRTRGVAMLRLKESEDVALVLRADVRTSRWLSLRLRFGARLSPDMPWQWTDGKQIRESFQNVTRQLEILDDQILGLEVAISQAERMRARRQEYLLEERRDQAEAFVTHWSQVAKRLAELDQLVALVEAGGHVEAKVSVQWPDGEQSILQLIYDDGEVAEGKVTEGESRE